MDGHPSSLVAKVAAGIASAALIGGGAQVFINSLNIATMSKEVEQLQEIKADLRDTQQTLAVTNTNLAVLLDRLERRVDDE